GRGNAVRASGEARSLLDVTPVLRVGRVAPRWVRPERAIRVVRVPLQILLAGVGTRRVSVHGFQLAVAGDLTGESSARHKSHHGGHSYQSNEKAHRPAPPFVRRRKRRPFHGRLHPILTLEVVSG